eukprot:g6390.t1
MTGKGQENASSTATETVPGPASSFMGGKLSDNRMAYNPSRLQLNFLKGKCMALTAGAKKGGQTKPCAFIPESKSKKKGGAGAAGKRRKGGKAGGKGTAGGAAATLDILSAAAEDLHGTKKGRTNKRRKTASNGGVNLLANAVA